MIEQRLWLKSPNDLTGKIFRINWLFVLLLCALAAIGYVALYSAAGGSPEPYAARHIIRFAFGLLLMVSIALVDIRVIARFSWVAYGIGVALLILVLKIGHIGKGAQRWLELGGQQIQPSELMKLGLILALAAWFHRASWERIGNPLFLLPPTIAVLIPVGLILKEPNLGTAMITVMLGGVIFFAAGVRLWKFILLLLPVPFAAHYIYQHLHDYQRARIDTFMNPESDPLGAGYNIIQSKIALGSGGFWGKGFLQGTQAHLDFLPEKQTDFIFTMIGEEFGLVGAVVVITLLILVTWGALLVGLRCKHQYGRLVAFGIACNFFFYCFVNIAMVMGVIPVGGVPLPLISHGGSAMITMMVAFGILMSVQVHRNVEFAGTEAER
jgi:rod shape determining protein RodA